MRPIASLPVLVWLVLPGAASADVWTFETPSENIQCSVGEEPEASDLTCTIIERSGPPARPLPADCMSNWGHTFFMRNTGPVEMLCEELQRHRDGFDRAEYGVTGTFGGFTCHSEKSGLTCRNEDGHGFALSRSRQVLF